MYSLPGQLPDVLITGYVRKLVSVISNNFPVRDSGQALKDVFMVTSLAYKYYTWYISPWWGGDRGVLPRYEPVYVSSVVLTASFSLPQFLIFLTQFLWNLYFYTNFLYDLDVFDLPILVKVRYLIQPLLIKILTLIFALASTSCLNMPPPPPSETFPLCSRSQFAINITHNSCAWEDLSINKWTQPVRR